MLALRRLAPATASRIVSAAARPVVVRCQSTLDDRKRGAEAAFIKEQEDKRLAEAKARFEALMKSENSEEKQELIEMLGTWQTNRVTALFSLCTGPS